MLWPKALPVDICVEFLSHNIRMLQLVKIEILDPSVGVLQNLL